ncbi:MAG: hypothetical protein AAF517_00985 [Planctomycetota bacterium]
MTRRFVLGLLVCIPLCSCGCLTGGGGFGTGNGRSGNGGGVIPNGLTGPGAKKPKPSWIDSPPRDRSTIFGIGVAAIDKSKSEAQRTADEFARQEIAVTIRAEVNGMSQSSSTVRGRIVGEDATATIDVENVNFVEVVGKGTLAGAEIVKRYDDGVSIYSLAAMNRVGAARAIADRIKTLRNEAEPMLKRGKDPGTPPNLAIDSLLRAFELYSQADLADATHITLVGKEANPATDLRAEAAAALSSMISNVSIEIERGQNQVVTPGSALPEKIVVRVQYSKGGSTTPVPHVRLGLEAQNPKAVEISHEMVTTGTDGRATFRVPSVTSTGKVGNHISVSFLAEQVGLRKLPKARVNYRLRTKETVRILVILKEINADGSEVKPGRAAPRLIGAIEGKGYQVVAEDKFLRSPGLDSLLSDSIGALQKAIGGDVDIIVRGKATAVESNAFKRTKAAKSSARIQAIDLSTGRIIGTKPPSDIYLQGSTNSLKDAGAKSLEMLGDGYGKAVVNDLNRALAGSK